MEQGHLQQRRMQLKIIILRSQKEKDTHITHMETLNTTQMHLFGTQKHTQRHRGPPCGRCRRDGVHVSRCKLLHSGQDGQVAHCAVQGVVFKTLRWKEHTKNGDTYAYTHTRNCLTAVQQKVTQHWKSPIFQL